MTHPPLEHPPEALLSKSTIKKIYFMGIAGTGMGSVAGLCKEAGFDVSGSDLNIYPPMSDMLERMDIKVQTPYLAEHINDSSADLVVVANALSRGNVEIEAVLNKRLKYTSFPKLLGDLFLKDCESVVVTGTHGKTTTSSLLAHILRELGEDPGYLIGGVPKNFNKGFEVGSGKTFISEGDEYDTAFFDKKSKFLHYYPKTLLINNLEFDHADIFKDLDAIKTMFKELIEKVKVKSNVLCNWDDLNVRELIQEVGLVDQITKVASFGESKDTYLDITTTSIDTEDISRPTWAITYNSVLLGEFRLHSPLTGRHNMANLSMVVATLCKLMETKAIKAFTCDDLQQALASFQNVKRRLEYLGSAAGTDIFEDFAHHPTAVKMIIDNFKTSFPKRRLVVAFEPKNATARRNVFEEQYSRELAHADVVLLGACPSDERIPLEQRMDTKRICERIGSSAHRFGDNDQILQWLKDNARDNDIVVFMSSGSFSGIQHKSLEALKSL